MLTWDGAELVVVRAGAVVEVDRWGDAAEEPTREVLSLAELLAWDGADLVVTGAVVEVDRWGDAAEEPTREVLSLAEWAWAWRDCYRRARAGEGGGSCSRAG